MTSNFESKMESDRFQISESGGDYQIHDRMDDF